jgi:hypothetical protein
MLNKKNPGIAKAVSELIRRCGDESVIEAAMKRDLNEFFYKI